MLCHFYPKQVQIAIAGIGDIGHGFQCGLGVTKLWRESTNHQISSSSGPPRGQVFEQPRFLGFLMFLVIQFFFSPDLYSLVFICIIRIPIRIMYGIYIYMLTWLEYIDGIHDTIYSSTMDPHWVRLGHVGPILFGSRTLGSPGVCAAGDSTCGGSVLIQAAAWRHISRDVKSIAGTFQHLRHAGFWAVFVFFVGLIWAYIYCFGMFLWMQCFALQCCF